MMNIVSSRSSESTCWMNNNDFEKYQVGNAGSEFVIKGGVVMYENVAAVQCRLQRGRNRGAQPFTAVPHAVVNFSTTINLFLCYFITNFATVVNRNVNICVFDGLRQIL